MLSWLVLIDRGFNPINYFSLIDYTLSCFQRIISHFIGDDSNEDTPVPIPNTEVKLIYGEDSQKRK